MNDVSQLNVCRPLQESWDRAPGAHLVLLPTEGCNLRCVYCYQGHPGGLMPTEVRSGVKRLMERLVEDGRRWLHLEWYGGEPLAGWVVVEELASHARQLVDDRGIDVSMSMTTNATLLDEEKVAALLEWGCSDYQITLDGPRDWHDRRRTTASQTGSFDRAWRGLQLLRDTDSPFRAVVRLGFDRDNLQAILDWIPELALEFADDPRFVFSPRVISYPGTDSPQIPMDSAPDVSAHLEAELVRAGLLTVDYRDEYRPGGLGCYAGRPDSIMIGTRGTLHKCAVGLESRDNEIGTLNSDGTVELDHELWQGWVASPTPCLPSENASCPRGPAVNASDALACPRGPAVTMAGAAACPRSPASCPRGPAVKGIDALACPRGPAVTEAGAAACPRSPAACPRGPAVKGLDALACPRGPAVTVADAAACPRGPAACPRGPAVNASDALACPRGPAVTMADATACPRSPAACPRGPAVKGIDALACPRGPASCPRGPAVTL